MSLSEFISIQTQRLLNTVSGESRSIIQGDMGAREIPSGVEKEGWGGYICCFTGMSVHGRSDKMLPSGEAPIRAAVCKHRDGNRFIFRGESVK